MVAIRVRTGPRAGTPGQPEQDCAGGPRRRWRAVRPRRSLLAAALVCLLAALFGEPVADELDLADLVGSLTAVIAGAHLAAITRSLRPAWLPVLVALAGAHYLATALAVRAPAA